MSVWSDLISFLSDLSYCLWVICLHSLLITGLFGFSLRVFVSFDFPVPASCR